MRYGDDYPRTESFDNTDFATTASNYEFWEVDLSSTRFDDWSLVVEKGGMILCVDVGFVKRLMVDRSLNTSTHDGHLLCFRIGTTFHHLDTAFGTFVPRD